MKKLLWQTKYSVFFIFLLATYLSFANTSSIFFANLAIHQIDTNKVIVNIPTKSGGVSSSKKVKKRCGFKRSKTKATNKVNNNTSNNPTLLDSIQKAKQKGKGF